MNTAAKPISTEGSHFYYRDGRPCYTVPYADPRKGERATTLADARKLNLLPSVTTILKCLHRQALVEWLIEQSVLAVLTTPRNEGEELDAFIYRVLHGEKVQDQEARAARDRGTEIHAAIESAFTDPATVNTKPIWPWIQPAFDAVRNRGRWIASEAVVVGNGYAGKVDLIQDTGNEIWIYDYKTSKKLPKGDAYWEHRCQLGAYASAWAKGEQPIRTANVYISTTEEGKFTVCEHGDWQPSADAFMHLVKYWQLANGYCPA